MKNRIDPVHADKDGWYYFWNHVGGYRCGPYTTEKIARDRFRAFFDLVACNGIKTLLKPSKRGGVSGRKNRSGNN